MLYYNKLKEDKLRLKTKNLLILPEWQKGCFLTSYDGNTTVVVKRVVDGGVVLLLDMINSPFINGSGECSIQEVISAMFVICKREKAADYIYGITRSEKAISNTAELAKQSEAHYAQYLKALDINSHRWIEFDKQVTEFSNKIGSFDLLSAVLDLKEYLNTCLAIFGHVPKNNSDNKKKDMTLNG